MSAILVDAAACCAFRALRFLLRLLPVRCIVHWPCPFLLKPVVQLLLGRRARSTLKAAVAGLQERGCRPGSVDHLVQESSLHLARALALFLRLPVEETELREILTLDRDSGEELSKDLAAGGCVLVSAHFGAFELIIPALVALWYRTSRSICGTWTNLSWNIAVKSLEDGARSCQPKEA